LLAFLPACSETFVMVTPISSSEAACSVEPTARSWAPPETCEAPVLTCSAALLIIVRFRLNYRP
jgi:hypothetical protein